MTHTALYASGRIVMLSARPSQKNIGEYQESLNTCEVTAVYEYSCTSLDTLQIKSYRKGGSCTKSISSGQVRNEKIGRTCLNQKMFLCVSGCRLPRDMGLLPWERKRVLNSQLPGWPTGLTSEKDSSQYLQELARTRWEYFKDHQK